MGRHNPHGEGTLGFERELVPAFGKAAASRRTPRVTVLGGYVRIGQRGEFSQTQGFRPSPRIDTEGLHGEGFFSETNTAKIYPYHLSDDANLSKTITTSRRIRPFIAASEPVFLGGGKYRRLAGNDLDCREASERP